MGHKAMWFRDSSVRTKLMILMMLASSLALLLMCIVLLAYDVSTAKQATAAHVSSLTQIITDNSQAAVSFGDPKAAHEVLSTLRAEPHIDAAYIFDKQGKPFAEYHAQGLSIYSVPVLRSPGAYFEAGGLSEYRQMTVGGENIGSVCIVSDLADVDER